MGAPRVVPNELSGFEYRELSIDRFGGLVDPEEAIAIGRLQSGGVTDLVVLAHGWNNDQAEAFALYQKLAASFAKAQLRQSSARRAGRVLGLVGVFWPSKKFADADLIPGRAASIEDADPALINRLRDLRGTFDADDANERLARATVLVPSLKDSPSAMAEFVDLVRGLVPGLRADDNDGSALLLGLDPVTVTERLDDPTLGDPEIWLGTVPAVGGVRSIDDGPAPPPELGSAAFIGIPEGLTSAARRLLNCMTYYQMKERAGIVAQLGLVPVLQQVVTRGQRIHLVGHSFGARLVTVAGSAEIGPRISSVSLLQAAFSHYSFAEQWKPGADGAFRSILRSGRLAGPMLVTHTRNDKAVGLAYAIASRLARQVAADIGDADSRYGGLGSNGAQRTPEAIPAFLRDAHHEYEFSSGMVYNLQADDFVKGHGDITGIEVANAILAAIHRT